jgi:hypothetical protein
VGLELRMCSRTLLALLDAQRIAEAEDAAVDGGELV